MAATLFYRRYRSSSGLNVFQPLPHCTEEPSTDKSQWWLFHCVLMLCRPRHTDTYWAREMFCKLISAVFLHKLGKKVNSLLWYSYSQSRWNTANLSCLSFKPRGVATTSTLPHLICHSLTNKVVKLSFHDGWMVPHTVFLCWQTAAQQLKQTYLTADWIQCLLNKPKDKEIAKRSDHKRQKKLKR